MSAEEEKQAEWKLRKNGTQQAPGKRRCASNGEAGGGREKTLLRLDDLNALELGVAGQLRFFEEHVPHAGAALALAENGDEGRLRVGGRFLGALERDDDCVAGAGQELEGRKAAQRRDGLRGGEGRAGRGPLVWRGVCASSFAAAAAAAAAARTPTVVDVMRDQSGEAWMMTLEPLVSSATSS